MPTMETYSHVMPAQAAAESERLGAMRFGQCAHAPPAPIAGRHFGQDVGMRAVVQVVTSASVSVAAEVIGAIHEPGLVVFVGVTHDDTLDHAKRLAAKVWNLRVMDGERSASDAAAPLLVISQFTLYADLTKGRRPSWSAAAPRSVSEPLIDGFCDALLRLGAAVHTGQFGANMSVTLVNDGPRTIVVDV